MLNKLRSLDLALLALRTFSAVPFCSALRLSRSAVTYFTFTLLLLAFSVLWVRAWANLQISSAVDRNEVPINETFTYAITVQGEKNIGSLNIPDIADFEKLGQSQSTQIQFINGNISRSISFQFTLRPLKQGTLIIPAFKFGFQDQEYQTEAISVKVLGPSVGGSGAAIDPFDLFRDEFFNRRSSRSLPSQEMDLRLSVLPSRSTMYEGEKFQVTVKICYDRGFASNPQITLPEFSGFIVKESENNFEHGEETIAGKRYNTETLLKTLSPLKSGTLSLGELSLVYHDNPLAAAKQKSSVPVNVVVKPLPQPQPQDFSGAVGSFFVKVALVGSVAAKTFDSLPLKIEVAGLGNLDRVSQLPLNLGQDIRSYLDGTSSDETVKGNEIHVRKTFNYFLVPEKSGTLALPAFQFTYFDPKLRQYKTQPVPLPILNVAAGTAAQTVGGASGPAARKDQVIQISLDIKKSQSLKKFALLALMTVVTVTSAWAFWMALSKFRRRKIRLLQIRMNQLRQIEALPNWSKSAYELLIDVVHYRWNIKLRGVTLSNVKAALALIPASQADQILASLEALESLRFAPTLVAEGKEKVIAAIETCLK